MNQQSSLYGRIIKSYQKRIQELTKENRELKEQIAGLIGDNLALKSKLFDKEKNGNK